MLENNAPRGRRHRASHLIAKVCLLLFLGGQTHASRAVELAGVFLPPSVEISGHQLRLALCGIRDTLWIDHYVASVYLPGSVTSPAEAADIIASPHYPKQVQLDILSSEWFPETLPQDWRAPLMDHLADAPFRRVLHAYQSLSAGDVVTLQYLPETGVEIWINARLVARDPGHGLINSILSAWSGPGATEQYIRNLASGHLC